MYNDYNVSIATHRCRLIQWYNCRNTLKKILYKYTKNTIILSLLFLNMLCICFFYYTFYNSWANIEKKYFPVRYIVYSVDERIWSEPIISQLLRFKTNFYGTKSWIKGIPNSDGPVFMLTFKLAYGAMVVRNNHVICYIHCSFTQFLTF